MKPIVGGGAKFFDSDSGDSDQTIHVNQVRQLLFALKGDGQFSE